MKIRQGFVSNSSASSFLIDATKYNKHMVTDAIETLLELNNKIEKEDKYINDICVITEEQSCKNFFKQYKEFYGYEEEYARGKFPKNCIRVDSTGDNSIPWEIQEYLENKFEAFRAHWS